MIEVTLWLRISVFGMEVPGANTGKFFPRHFSCHSILHSKNKLVKVTTKCSEGHY